MLSTTPGLILVSFSIFYLFSIRHYHSVASRDPTSFFFDPNKAYERLYSTRRIEQADAFVASAVGSLSRPAPPTQPPWMCIGIATIARQDEQYVRWTVGSLLEGLTTDQRQSIYLNLLIAHTDPSKHPIYGEIWVETLPNNVLRYKNGTGDFTRVQSWERDGLYRNKTIYDYTYLLSDCYNTGAEYVAMIEDDTIASAGWLPKALLALHEVEAAMQSRRGSKWIYLRLFFTEDLLGWNSEEWQTYLSLSMFLWGLLVVSLLTARRFSNSIRGYLSDASILVLSCICLPALIGLHFLAGRQTMWPFAPGIREMNKYGCCSQGYIFPRVIISELLEKTDLETDWLVDMMVEQIADKEGYARWATVPALLQHIGTKSSKGYGFDKSAGSLWNFGFELHEPYVVPP